MKSVNWFILLLIALFTISLLGCTAASSGDKQAGSFLKAEPRYTYHEFDMIFVYYKTKVYEPKFGNPNRDFTLLQVAAMFPDKLEVKVGEADIQLNDEAAKAYSERLGRIYSIQPSEKVLAYYLKNKFVSGFNR